MGINLLNPYSNQKDSSCEIKFDSELTCFSWSPQNNKFAVATGNLIKIYTINTKEEYKNLGYYKQTFLKYITIEISRFQRQDPQGTIYEIRWLDDSTIVTCHSNGYIKIWDIQNQFEMKSIFWPFSKSFIISCSQAGKKLALPENSKLYICDTDSVKLLAKIDFNSCIISSVFWAPDNSKLAIIIDSCICIYDLSTYPHHLHILQTDYSPTIGAWSPESCRFAYKTSENILEIWQAQSI